MGKSLKNKGLKKNTKRFNKSKKKNNRKIQSKMIGGDWGKESELYTTDHDLKNAVSDSWSKWNWDVFNVIEIENSGRNKWNVIQKYNVGVKDGKIYYQQRIEFELLRKSHPEMVEYMETRRFLFKIKDNVVLTLPQIANIGRKEHILTESSPLVRYVYNMKEKYGKLTNIPQGMVTNLYDVCAFLKKSGQELDYIITDQTKIENLEAQIRIKKDYKQLDDESLKQLENYREAFNGWLNAAPAEPQLFQGVEASTHSELNFVREIISEQKQYFNKVIQKMDNKKNELEASVDKLDKEIQELELEVRDAGGQKEQVLHSPTP